MVFLVVSFDSDIPTDMLYVFHFYAIHATFPAHLFLSDMIILIILGEEYRLWSSSLFSFFQPPTISFFFSSDILLSTLSSNTFILHLSLNVRPQVSHPNRIIGKIVVLYSIIFTFLDSR
jgi:hypothetical protein